MVVMNFLFAITITLQTAFIMSKKRMSSEESIENILFYKDFRAKKEPAPLPPANLDIPKPPPPPPPQPECIPRMCCTMSCTNTCGQSNMIPSMDNGGLLPIPPMNQISPPNPLKPMQTALQNQMPPMPHLQQQYKKKKLPQLPFPSRKSFGGFTREHIKSLIAKDEDIKNILKDLVRVTMKKVDLLQLIKSRRAGNVGEHLELNNDDDDEVKEW